MKFKLSAVLISCLVSFTFTGCRVSFYYQVQVQRMKHSNNFNEGLLPEVEKQTGLDQIVEGSQEEQWWLTKQGITQLLLGGNLTTRSEQFGTELDPKDFKVDPKIVDQIFENDEKTAFQFVHMSDIQLRDRGTDLGRFLSRQIDVIATEVMHTNFYQDNADLFYLGYLLKAIRMAVMKGKVESIVHTGDAVQLGISSELLAYNEMIGKFLLIGSKSDWNGYWNSRKGANWLHAPLGGSSKDGFHTLSLHEQTEPIPYMNALGNHDIMIVGNMNGKGTVRSYNRAPHKDPIPFFFPDEHVTNNSRSRSAKDSLILETLHSVERLDQVNRNWKLPGLNRNENGEFETYYCKDVATKDQGFVRFIVLNTNEKNTFPVIKKYSALNPIQWLLYGFNVQLGSTTPSISDRQFKWMKQKLQSAQEDEKCRAVLVFGHNLLKEISLVRDGCKIKEIGIVGNELGNYTKVKGYFCGHVHSGSPAVTWVGKKHVFYEFISPSVQEFSKSFSVVQLVSINGEYQLNTVKHFNLEDVLGKERYQRIESLTAKDGVKPVTRWEWLSYHAFGRWLGLDPEKEQYDDLLVEWVNELFLVSQHFISEEKSLASPSKKEAASTEPGPSVKDLRRQHRIEVLAKHCYLGATYDRAYLASKSIEDTFDQNKDNKEALNRFYSSAQSFLDYHRAPGVTWQDMKKKLDFNRNLQSKARKSNPH